MRSEASWTPEIVSGAGVAARVEDVLRAVAVTARFLRLPADRRQLRFRAIRDGLLISGLLATAFILVVVPAVGRSLGYDAYAYWSIDPATLYDRTLTGQYALGGFRYAPPIGLLFATFHVLPWWLFLWLWIALMVAALVFLGGRWSLALLALPPLALELEQGNVHLFIAAAIVVGFRWPWSWAFVLLTKVTPGVGLVWFAARREWRSLAIALGFTAAVSALAFVVAPGLWAEWLRALSVHLGQSQDYSLPPPLPLRLPFAIALVLWGAKTDRPWTVGVAAMLSLPILWVHGLVVGLAAVPFLRRRAAERRAGDPATSGARFITLRELLGRGASGDVTGRAVSGTRLLTTSVMVLAVAFMIAVVAGPVIAATLTSASSAIDVASSAIGVATP
jgi:hypothetical protein